MLCDGVGLGKTYAATTMRPRVRMSLDGTMRESFEREMRRMVASGTPCAASGATASRCQVLTYAPGRATRSTSY